MKLLRFALAATLAAPLTVSFPARADDAATHMALAQTAANAGDFVKAGAEIDAALKLEPDNIAALMGRTTVCAAQKDFAGAVKAVSHILELQPTNANALRMRAAMYGQLGEMDKGEADFIGFLRLSDEGFTGAKAQAQAATDAKQWQQAFKVWDLLAKAHPADATCLFNRGKANLMLHPREMFESDAHLQAEREAAADFDAAAKADPNFTAGIIFQAGRARQLFVMEDDLKSGIAALTTALNRLPGNEDLLAARADLEKQLSSKTYFTDKPTSQAMETAALLDYSLVLQAHPKNFAALLGRAAATEDAQPTQALSDASAALAQKPDDIDALKLHANLLGRKKDYAGAVADYDHLLAVHPDSDASFERILVLQYLPDKTRALSEISRFIAASPDSSIYFSVRAEIYAAQKDFARALSDIDKAIQLDPNDKSWQNTRAEILAAQKAAG